MWWLQLVLKGWLKKDDPGSGVYLTTLSLPQWKGCTYAPWKRGFPCVFWHLAEVYILEGQRHQGWSRAASCVFGGRNWGLAGGRCQAAGRLWQAVVIRQASVCWGHICAKHCTELLTRLSSFKIALGGQLLLLILHVMEWNLGDLSNALWSLVTSNW